MQRNVLGATAAFALLATSLLGSPAIAGVTAVKQTSTPSFCQLDPTAHFKGAGSNYCAPTSVADGLIYLTVARKKTGLTAGNNHDAQVKLIKQLASAMGADPATGTGPGGIMTGLQAYVNGKGFKLDRLEYQGWRNVGSANKAFNKGAQPQLAWLQQAANNPDAVLLLNIGWYQPAKGGQKRMGGHWVDVVGQGPNAGDFQIRNPALKVADQPTHSSVTLTALDKKFKIVASPGNPPNMANYFKIQGAALPMGKAYTAVLDSAIVFTLKK